MDSALRALIERESGIRDVEVVFDAPTREWAGRRTAPTVDVYLYDIREDLRRRSRGVLNSYDEKQTRIIGRHLPPRHFKLSYLVTAWTQRPEDEHRLLSSLLGAFLRYDALPADLLSGPLAEIALPVPLTVGLPPPEDRGFADVWSALGGELKPSIDVVVSAPIDTGQQLEVGPPVLAPPRFSIGGRGGFPGTEDAALGPDRAEGQRAGDAAVTIRGPQPYRRPAEEPGRTGGGVPSPLSRGRTRRPRRVMTAGRPGRGRRGGGARPAPRAAGPAMPVGCRSAAVAHRRGRRDDLGRDQDGDRAKRPCVTCSGGRRWWNGGSAAWWPSAGPRTRTPTTRSAGSTSATTWSTSSWTRRRRWP